jgi:hypothetical protein
MRLALRLAATAMIALGVPATACSAAPAPETQTAKADAVTPAQTARKLRSQSILKAEGVPFIDWLPAVEDVADYRPRSTEEIAARAYALTLVAYKATTNDHEGANRAYAAVKDRVALSPSEADFLRDPAPSNQDRVHFSWQSEAALPLFWMLGYVDALARPEVQNDPDPMVRLISGQSFDALIAGARLRPQADMLDVLDLTYRYHWAAVDARINERDAPAGLNPDILMERHKALNWLVRYNADASWDDVTTDT